MKKNWPLMSELIGASNSSELLTRLRGPLYRENPK